jgi:hypothetical protein
VASALYATLAEVAREISLPPNDVVHRVPVCGGSKDIVSLWMEPVWQLVKLKKNDSVIIDQLRSQDFEKRSPRSDQSAAHSV